MHIRNWCHWKGLDFLIHPQFAAPKGKSIVFIVVNHKMVVIEGLNVLKGVNARSSNNMIPNRSCFYIIKAFLVQC